jgi:hypothetical protein
VSPTLDKEERYTLVTTRAFTALEIATGIYKSLSDFPCTLRDGNTRPAIGIGDVTAIFLVRVYQVPTIRESDLKAPCQVSDVAQEHGFLREP